MVRETIISPNDFIVPLFIVEGKNVKEEIASMPGYFRYSLDLIEKRDQRALEHGSQICFAFCKSF